MTSSIMPRLLGLSSAAHFADQLTLATILLAAGQLGAGAGLTGMLVAAQSLAWLLVSLPAGALIDRLSRRRLILVGAGLAAAGSALGAAAFAISSAFAPLLLGAATLIAASGVVTIVLAIFALLPAVVPSAGLPRANAAIELSRAVVTPAAPILAGALVAMGAPALALVAAALSGLAALGLSAGLPQDRPPAVRATSLAAAIGGGARLSQASRFSGQLPFVQSPGTRRSTPPRHCWCLLRRRYWGWIRLRPASPGPPTARG